MYVYMAVKLDRMGRSVRRNVRSVLIIVSAAMEHVSARMIVSMARNVT